MENTQTISHSLDLLGYSENWLSISTGKPQTIKQILNQFIFHNQYILVDKKAIRPNNLRAANPDIKIIDLLEEDGKFISAASFNEKFNTKANILNVIY